MKIVHVIRRWKGGVGTYVSEISKELEKLGHEVEIISREEDLGITSLFGSLEVLRKAVIRKKADVVNAHDWSIALPLMGLKNLVITFHGYEAFPKIFLQKLVSRSAPLVVVSKKLLKMFPQAYLVEEGVDLSRFRPIDIDKIPNSIGFAQNPIEFYNFENIVKAAKILDLNVVVAWTKKRKTQFDNVKFMGNMEREKMPWFYSSLDVFISLPKRSGFNLVWLEAMGCEVPTVGNYEGIGEELPIVHVKSNKPEDIAEAIEAAMKLRGKTKYREWITKRGLTWDRSAKKLIKIYESVVKS